MVIRDMGNVGYVVTNTLCETCKRPLMERNQVHECVVCSAIEEFTQMMKENPHWKKKNVGKGVTKPTIRAEDPLQGTLEHSQKEKNDPVNDSPHHDVGPNGSTHKRFGGKSDFDLYPTITHSQTGSTECTEFSDTLNPVGSSNSELSDHNAWSTEYTSFETERGLPSDEVRSLSKGSNKTHDPHNAGQPNFGIRAGWDGMVPNAQVSESLFHAREHMARQSDTHESNLKPQDHPTSTVVDRSHRQNSINSEPGTQNPIIPQLSPNETSNGLEYYSVDMNGFKEHNEAINEQIHDVVYRPVTDFFHDESIIMSEKLLLGWALLGQSPCEGCKFPCMSPPGHTEEICLNDMCPLKRLSDLQVSPSVCSDDSLEDDPEILAMQRPLLSATEIEYGDKQKDTIQSIPNASPPSCHDQTARPKANEQQSRLNNLKQDAYYRGTQKEVDMRKTSETVNKIFSVGTMPANDTTLGECISHNNEVNEGLDDMFGRKRVEQQTETSPCEYRDIDDQFKNQNLSPKSSTSLDYAISMSMDYSDFTKISNSSTPDSVGVLLRKMQETNDQLKNQMSEDRSGVSADINAQLDMAKLIRQLADAVHDVNDSGDVSGDERAQWANLLR